MARLAAEEKRQSLSIELVERYGRVTATWLWTNRLRTSSFLVQKLGRASTGLSQAKPGLERRSGVVTRGNRRRSRIAQSTESIVLAVIRPRTYRHVTELNELPVTEINVVER
jgi:hypothetical protein